MNDSFSFNLTEFHYQSRLRLQSQVVGYSLWIFIGSLSTFFNCFSLFIFSQLKAKFSESSRICIINLCAGDLLLAVHSALYGAKQLILYFTDNDDVTVKWKCVLQLLILQVGIDISMTITIVLSVDRLFAVAFPLQYLRNGVRLAKILCFVCWFDSFLFASFTFGDPDIDRMLVTCSALDVSYTDAIRLRMISGFVLLMVMCVINMLILWIVRSKASLIQRDLDSDMQQPPNEQLVNKNRSSIDKISARQVRVAKSVGVLVACYVVCWLSTLGSLLIVYVYFNASFYSLSPFYGLMIPLNSIANFFIYVLSMNQVKTFVTRFCL